MFCFQLSQYRRVLSHGRLFLAVCCFLSTISAVETVPAYAQQTTPSLEMPETTMPPGYREASPVAVEFANEQCYGRTFQTLIEVTDNSQLEQAIRTYSESNSEQWLALSENSLWEYDTTPSGVLYLLQSGTTYTAGQLISHHYHELAGVRRAPRIGICGMGSTAASVTVRAMGGLDETRGSAGQAPIDISQTQLELYNLTVDGSGTRTGQSSIRLQGDARLITERVTMTRRGMTSSQREYGLIYLDYSWLKISDSELSQQTDTGTMINSYESTLDLDNSGFTVTAGIWVFYSFGSVISVVDSRFNGIERGGVRPAVMDSLNNRHGFLSAGIGEACRDPFVQVGTRLCLKNSELDDDCYFAVEDGPYEGQPCWRLRRYCPNNILSFRDNRFDGNWEYWGHVFNERFRNSHGNTRENTDTPCLSQGSSVLSGELFVNGAGCHTPGLQVLVQLDSRAFFAQARAARMQARVLNQIEAETTETAAAFKTTTAFKTTQGQSESSVTESGNVTRNSQNITHQLQIFSDSGEFERLTLSVGLMSLSLFLHLFARSA